jgi:hypothetical protein
MEKISDKKNEIHNMVKDKYADAARSSSGGYVSLNGKEKAQ